MIMQFQGVVLTFLALLNLSFVLGNREAIDILNAKIGLARIHAVVIFSSIFMVYTTGILTLLNKNEITLGLMIISSIILGVFLLYMEGTVSWTMFKEMQRPRISRDLLNILFYIAVLWHIFESVDVGWLWVSIASTIFLLLAIPYMKSLWFYFRISSYIIEPVDLSYSIISIRIFSLLMGVHLASIEIYMSVFRGFIALSYLMLAYTLYVAHREMKEVVRMLQ